MSKGVEMCNCMAYSRNLKDAISLGVGKLGIDERRVKVRVCLKSLEGCT